MRLPFVSVATYDWAIRHSERLADEADRERERAEAWAVRHEKLYDAWVQSAAKVRELTDIIVDMKKQNFVVDVPITSVPLSVDEADEYAVAEEEARPALLKRKLGT